jgi:uncharacterized protein YecT (DUF1311 family)
MDFRRFGWRACLVVVLAMVSGWYAPAALATVSVTQQTVDEHTAADDIQFAYPQIGIAADDTLLTDWTNSLLSEFRASVAARTPSEPPYSAKLSYSVTRNDERAVVILFKYSIYTGGAHSNYVQTTFNFLLPDGTRVFLPDLIGDAGIQRVSDLAIANLSASLGATGYADPSWIRTGAGPYADNFESFEWQPSELVVHFDPYQVASYADGPQEVHIPMDQLQDVLRPEPRVPLPSFDCSRAATNVENAICSDQALAQLDRRVAEAYGMRLRLEAIGGQTPTVQAQQIQWLAQRDSDCGGTTSGAGLVSCLKGEYSQRLMALQRFG